MENLILAGLFGVLFQILSNLIPGIGKIITPEITFGIMFAINAALIVLVYGKFKNDVFRDARIPSVLIAIFGIMNWVVWQFSSVLFGELAFENILPIMNLTRGLSLLSNGLYMILFYLVHKRLEDKKIKEISIIAFGSAGINMFFSIMGLVGLRKFFPDFISVLFWYLTQLSIGALFYYAYTIRDEKKSNKSSPEEDIVLNLGRRIILFGLAFQMIFTLSISKIQEVILEKMYLQGYNEIFIYLHNFIETGIFEFIGSVFVALGVLILSQDKIKECNWLKYLAAFIAVVEMFSRFTWYTSSGYYNNRFANLLYSNNYILLMMLKLIFFIFFSIEYGNSKLSKASKVCGIWYLIFTVLTIFRMIPNKDDNLLVFYGLEIFVMCYFFISLKVAQNEKSEIKLQSV